MNSQSQAAIQTQQQQQLQQLHLTPLQLQTVRMLEMPLAQLEDNIRQELAANPSLQAEQPEGDEYKDNTQPETQETQQDEYPDTYDDSSDRLLSDDYTPSQATPTQPAGARDIERGAITSFSDTLAEQVGELDITDTQRQIIEYLIGSLDNDGLLRKDTTTISDELAIYNNIYTTDDEIETMIAMLQEFNPAGIGARDLKECLTIQIGRMRATPTTMLMYDIVTRCYDDFISNRWQNICRTLGISEDTARDIRHEIRRRLNPKPGAAMGEAEGRTLMHITPDITVSVDDTQHITFEVNHGNIPILHVSDDDERLIADLQRNNTQAGKEALAFTQQYVDKAKIFIEAIRQREETMARTMTAIIHRQRQYFITGDETDLAPMKLKDIAQDTGYDISTISRFSRSKYIETRWGTISVRSLFSEAYDTGKAGIVSTKAIKNTLSDIIRGEDKTKPLSDDKLVALMKEKGYPIARRTIAKYREQMGIPVARLRRK